MNMPTPRVNMHVLRGRSPLRATLVALAAITTAVSGCSSTDAGSRQAENLGTRICITDNYVDGVNVKYTTLDADASSKDPFYYEGDLEQDTESCAEGSVPNGNDLEGNLVIPGEDLPFSFVADNPLIGEPFARITQRQSADPNSGLYEATKICTDTSGFKVGDARLWDNGTVRISITRLNDDQWKEFVINLEPSQGQRVGDDPCGGGPG